MQIPDFILALIVIYFLIVTMLVIGAMSRYTFKKIKPQNKSIKKRIKQIDNLVISIAIGIFTGATVIVYYNWTNCLFFECRNLSTLNFFNSWFLSAVIVVVIAIGVFIILYVVKWILLHKKI